MQPVPVLAVDAERLATEGRAAESTLLHGDLAGVMTALPLALSRRPLRTMRQNLSLAFVYDVVGVPIAAGVLHPATGLLPGSVLASAAMAASPVSVLANSLRLRSAELA